MKAFSSAAIGGLSLTALVAVSSAAPAQPAGTGPLPRFSSAQWIWDRAHTGESGRFTCFFRKANPNTPPPCCPTAAFSTAGGNTRIRICSRIQSLWTVNPDGTGTSAFWGNQSYWPDLLMEARPIPGSHRVMFAAHGHHEVYWGGVGMLDVTQGFNYPDGLTKVTQELPWIEVGNGPAERMETDQYHTSGGYGGYKSPYPLSDELFLVSIRQGSTDARAPRLFLLNDIRHDHIIRVIPSDRHLVLEQQLNGFT